MQSQGVIYPILKTLFLAAFILSFMHTPPCLAQDMRYQAHMDLTDPFQQEVLSLIPVMDSLIGRTLPMSVIIWHPSLRLSDRLETSRRALERVAAA